MLHRGGYNASQAAPAGAVPVSGDRVATTEKLKILVPADVPATTYEVSFRAEVLGPDNRTVVLSAATPPRRLPASK